MLTLDPVSPPAEAVEAIKAYLRIDQDDEDSLTATLTATAIRHCENFCGMILFDRGFSDRHSVSSNWQRLALTPVGSVTLVNGIALAGAPFALPVTDYAIDIDHNRDGWVRVSQPGTALRIDVIGRAGLATDWGMIPEPLRQGIIRLVSHQLMFRDSFDDVGAPAAVAALWKPFRRMRLS
jgi:uncharacterized phiE125 gp8 family phage protein